MEKSCHFVLLALLLPLLFSMDYSSATYNINSDRSSLLALKSHITLDPHNILTTNWSSESSVCSWIGVTCRNNRVTQLNISGMGLVGTIPQEIGNLSSLVSLDAGDNSFHGPIPPSIFNMSFLEDLDLNNNSLSSRLPFDVCKPHNNLHTRLKTLRIAYNKLEGEIPSSLVECSQLEYLSLYRNDFTGHVPAQIWNLTKLQYLSLGENSLSGPLPKDICRHNLPRLTSLELMANNFEGEIPLSLGECGQLEIIYLSANNFGGTVPTQIWNMTNLKTLSLGWNNLRGPIPSTIGNLTNLQNLFITSNELNGELPSSICNLTSLYSLLLSNNNLEGTIPQCFGSLSTSALSFLHLKGNQFSGIIPSTFTKGCNLVSINLSNNNLRGRLPKSLINCKYLMGIDVGDNRLQDIFPFWMEALPRLRVLVLRSNKFDGNMLLPSRTKLPFPKLQVLDISENAFVGSLPQRYFENFRAMIEENETVLLHDTFEVFVEMSLTLKGLDQLIQRMVKAFTTIDLSSNGFSGSIPNSIGNLKILKYLNLSHNNLIGNIPSSLGNMSAALESLDLSWNKLDGEIPNELTRLTFLAKLNLSMNNLVGRIPQSNQFSTFENDSYGGNVGLCGLPLTRKCREENGQSPTPMLPQGDDEFVEGFGWKCVVMGYGCGFLVGIGIGYIIVRSGKPIWLAEFFFGIGYGYNYKVKRRKRAQPRRGRT